MTELVYASGDSGAGDTGAGIVIRGLVMMLVLVVLYFLPTFIAAARKVPNLGSVAVINIFLGWTFIGWVVALAMSARSAPAQQPAPPFSWWTPGGWPPGGAPPPGWDPNPGPGAQTPQ